ncbi:MAG: SpoIIE family protein phosphatase [Cytophagales bacterium]|nr:SpoIIE family protein phosphatase [Cytophagales bacterium]
MFKYCFCCAIWLQILSLQAQTVVNIDSQTGRFDLNGKVKYLEDPNGKLTIDEINLFSTEWQKAEKTLNFGYTTSAYWIKFKVSFASHVNERWLLEVGYPVLDDVQFYYKHPTIENNRWQVVKTGELLPFRQRETLYRNFLFHLPLQADSEQTFYLRVSAESSLQIPLTLWSQKTFSEKINTENYVLGIYYGIILALALYNFFLFISVRDKSYLFYVLFIATLGILQMTLNGLAKEHLWPNSSWWSNHGVLIFVSFVSLWLSLFVKSFLQTRINTPKLHLFFHLTTGTSFIVIIMSLLAPYTISAKSSILLIAITLVAAILTGIISLIKGYRPARYYVIAWAVLVTGGLTYALKQYGILPRLFITEYGMQFGSTIEVILLSLALADRINILKKEKEEAQDKAMDKLEEKVKERTAEVVKQKEIIEVKNKDITDSIRYAKEIQETILPKVEKIAEILPESFILFKPKDIVSGDFYWAAQTKNNKVIWVAADCTGHGVPGAFMSIMCYTLLNEVVKDKDITEPAQILDELKMHIINELNQSGEMGAISDGMDISLCVLHKDTNKLEFAGAYNPLYLIRKGELIEIKADRQTVGYQYGKVQPFTNHEIQLQKGDTLYTFSDGYADQFGGDDNQIAGKWKKFSKTRFKELVLSLQQKSMMEQKKILDKTIENYKENLEQLDDILVIGVRI